MASIQSILFPTDFSPPSQRALDYVADLAQRFSARVVLLHVIPPNAYPLHNLAAVAGFPNLRDEIRKGVDRELEAQVKRLGQKVATATTVREGVVHEEILAACKEHGCDLVAMATNGHTGLKHAVLGSTAERIVRLSPKPVLTLRAAD